jgi:ATP-dependent DNA ligase
LQIHLEQLAAVPRNADRKSFKSSAVRLGRTDRNRYISASTLGCEGIVSKRPGSSYRSGRTDCWIKVKNLEAPAVRREAEEDWG